MKKRMLTCAIVGFLYTFNTNAHVGIGTTTPNSTLDVRGSISANYRAFTTSTSAATLTLPTAVTCTGRVYWIKNASSNTSVLTIATTSSQTIDGLSSWTLDESNQVVCFVSNGANWNVSSLSVPSNSSNAWIGEYRKWWCMMKQRKIWERTMQRWYQC